MESFYPARATRTHFFYAEPHNAELYYRFAPWERRYRRWLYSPSPGSIGRAFRSYMKYFSFGFMSAGMSLKRKSTMTVIRRSVSTAAKTANRAMLGKICINIWNTRWAPTTGLNG